MISDIQLQQFELHIYQILKKEKGKEKKEKDLNVVVQ